LGGGVGGGWGGGGGAAAAAGAWGGGGAAAWGAAAGGGGGAAGGGSNTGTVEKFDASKGFGFARAGDGTSYFFHQKQFVDGSSPVQGDTLTFDLEPSPIKPGQMQASNISGGTGPPTGKGGKGGGGGAPAWGGGGGDWGAAKGDGKSAGPRLSGKKMKLCEHFPNGTCRKMENCTFAHSEAEIGTPYGPADGGKGGAAAGPYGAAAWGGAAAAAPAWTGGGW